MNDLRGIPRWSKTAGIVMLVVFGLVLVTAVFGLWALSQKEDADLQEARADALARATHLVQDAREDLHREVENWLRRVGDLRDGAALKALLGEPGSDLLQEIYTLDARERVAWVDGAYLLHLPEGQLAELRDAQNERHEAWGRELFDRARRPDLDGTQSLAAWLELTEGFQLVTRPLSGEARAYPLGVAYAVGLLRRAREVLAAPGAPARPAEARACLLRALEVEALNRGRDDVSATDLRAQLAELRAEVAALLAHLPQEGREAIAWEVEAYRRARDRLLAPAQLRPLLAAARKVRDREARGDATAVASVLREDPELLGVVTLVGGQAHRVVRLDAAVFAARLDEVLRRLAVADLGVAPRVQGLADDAPAEAAAVVPLARPPLDLPLRVALVRVGDPSRGSGRGEDVIYWALIGVAALGMAVAGYFLARLLTREIHLARLKADFVSNLSHELKTPITSIALFTEMLQDGKITRPDERTEAYEVLHQECGRLRGIVERMMNVARGEERRSPYQLRGGDLNRPVWEAASRFRRIVVDGGLDLHLDLCPEPLPVHMDPAAVDDAVTNLLSNAWKYRRGDRARIAVRTARRGRRAELVVSDDGIGIPRRERRHVFEMFYRSNSLLSQSVPGTGLGLSLVRAIVRAHRGSVRIENGERGVGTRFRLRFPLGHPFAVGAGGDAAASLPAGQDRVGAGAAAAPAPPGPRATTNHGASP